MGYQRIVGLNAPPSNGVAVTPSDTTDTVDANNNKQPYREVYIGGAGDLTVTLIGMSDQQKVTFHSLAAGSALGMLVKRIWATGTTATNITGLW